MKDKIPDFIKDATNVYRTKGYIVKQVIGIQYDCKENNVVFSHDTFYSKGLPQYFVSDIMDEDVVCPFGLEDKKLLLYDDFLCWDEGVLIGAVSKAVISQMPKAN